MAFVLTDKPTAANVQTILTQYGYSSLSSGLDADLLALEIDSAVSAIEKETQRQFVPGSVGEIRYYDGSGTGLMVIDPYIDITAVEFAVFPQVTGVEITRYVEVEQQNTPKTRIQIFQGAPSISVGYLNHFPEGRSNIKVTGQFGYSAEIPANVFMAMAKMAAASVIEAHSASGGSGGGTLGVKGFEEADRKLSYESGGFLFGSRTYFSPVAVGFMGEVKAVCENYRRPLSERRRLPNFV